MQRKYQLESLVIPNLCLGFFFNCPRGNRKAGRNKYKLSYHPSLFMCLKTCKLSNSHKADLFVLTEMLLESEWMLISRAFFLLSVTRSFLLKMQMTDV